MSESNERFDLIDVGFEDDCLYTSPSRFLQFSDVRAEDKVAQLSLEGGDDGQVTEPLQSLEQEKTTKNDKYNLRKSLAWDSAFFTSAGVLEPDELSSIIGGADKGERKYMLPGIEEDIRKSSDSLSTLATDSSTLETLEDELFGDIRASIQKSCKSSNMVSESGVDQSKLPKSLEPGKVKTVPQNMLKTKAALKKPSVTTKASRKMANQASSSAQASKAASGNVGATSSLSKPPRIIGRPSAILATAAATSRISMGSGANRVKVEKDNAQTFPGHSDKAKVPSRGAKAPGTGGSQNTIHKPKLLVKSSLRSSVSTKKQLSTSSSIDSMESASPNCSSNHSLTTAKRCIDSRTSLTSSSANTTSRTASRSSNQSISPCASPYFWSVTKASSSRSPASSVSESSTESSPTSTLNKKLNTSRPILHHVDVSQVSESQNHSSNKCSVGHDTQVTELTSERGKRVLTGSALVRPDSIKPSGLRMPSPKIGFFDGARSTVQTSSGGTQTHPTVPNVTCRYDLGNIRASGGSYNTKPGKFQAARTDAVRGTKTGAEQLTSELEPKSTLPLQESSNAAPNICSAPRNGKHRPGVTQKVQNKKSHNLRAEKTAPKECNTALNDPDSGYDVMNDRICEDKTSPKNKSAPSKDPELFPSSGGSGATNNLKFYVGG